MESYSKLLNNNGACNSLLGSEIYCCAVWLNSAHTDKIDVELNRTMRIVNGNVDSTPLPWLPAISNILPPDIRRKISLMREYRKVMANVDLPLHEDIQSNHPKRLKSRKSPIETAKVLNESGFDPEMEWNESWTNTSYTSPIFDIGIDRTKEFKLPRKAWCNLNRLRTGHGCCNEMLFKWGYTDTSSCICGNAHQTMDHILHECLIMSYDGPIQDILELKESAVKWLNELKL